jgi:RimJ/RimL family protein N-acetyltransferase
VALARSFATLVNDGEFAAFECCGDEPTPHSQEVENYVRGWVLSKARYVLAFRDEEGELVAVAGFNRTKETIGGPEPEVVDAWKLEVVAIRSDRQQQGLSREVFAGVWEAMREVNDYFNHVVASVHRDNKPSRQACANVGLHTHIDGGEDYVSLLGVLSEMEEAISGEPDP